VRSTADLLALALASLTAGESAALAIVVKTWGSSPRPVGSLLVVRADGSFEGSVSGGCIEGDVITQALDVMSEGVGRMLDYSIANDRAWEVGLACGGSVQVALMPVGTASLTAQTLQAWHEALAAGRSAGVTLSPGPQLALADDPGSATLAYPARPRLAIIGAVHITQSLAPMAQLIDHEVIVIDPRGHFAAQERFPGIALASGWPDEALAQWGVTEGTAVVTLTHDPKLDDPALIAALRSPAYFIAALGSRKTHASRLERLKSAGFDEDALARIHGPAGLAIGAQTPAEIAASVLAQLIGAYRRAAPLSPN
jgi:xanthine dehydrogenase accessory factor